MDNLEDLKALFLPLWTEAFEDALSDSKNSSSLLILTNPEDVSGDEKYYQRKRSVYQLMLNAVFKFITNQLERHERKLEETDKRFEKLQALTERANQNYHGDETKICTPVVSPVIESKKRPCPKSPEEHRASNDNDSTTSPSLLRQKVVRRITSPKSKENVPRGTYACYEGENKQQKSKAVVSPTGRCSGKLNIIRTPVTPDPLRSTVISNQTVERSEQPSISNNFRSKLAKKMVQTRLELPRIVSKESSIDLSMSEEYLGGVRGPPTKRKSEDESDSDQAQPDSAIRIVDHKKLSRQAGSETSICAPVEGTDLDETYFDFDHHSVAPIEQVPQADEVRDSPMLFPESPEQPVMPSPSDFRPPITKGLLSLSRRKLQEGSKQSKPPTGTTPLSGAPPGFSGLGDDTMELITDFNKLPEKDKPMAKFKYKPDKAVRKKSERDKLPGITCDMCRDYYGEIASQLNSEDIDKIINRCSKHRQACKPRDQDTPPGFWRVDLPSTQEIKEKGLMHIDNDPDPKNRHRI